MGIMIRDEEIIAMLTKLAERDGTTRAAALLKALKNLHHETERGYRPSLFPRDRVTSRTWSI